MPGVVIAGISGSGKTHLHRAVTEAVTASGREIVLAFPQAMTTTAHQHLSADSDRQATQILEWCQQLTAFASRVHTQVRHGDLLSETENYPFNWTPMVLLEGFVFDVPLHDESITREQTRSIEKCLANMGLVLVVLEVPEDQIQAQCVESTRQHRGRGWSQHLDQLGDDDEQRADHFRTAQQRLLQWAEDSPLPTFRIDTSEQDWKGYTKQVLDIINERAENWRQNALQLMTEHPLPMD